MFKSDKAKLMYSLIICCCCVTLLTVSLAWFILGANPYEADGAIINTGEITLDAELYFGNDEDKNGVLEIDEEYEPIVGESDREKELGEKYEPMNASDNNVDDCFAMAKLTYRAVVKNNNDFPVKISLSYPKSDDYFISYLESTNLTYTDGNVSEVNSDNWDSIMKEKSARVMFRLKITGCRIYSAADVLIKSTYTEQAQVQSLVLSGETDYFLYDISETRPFFSNIDLGVGEIAEFDYVLERVGYSALSSNYRNYWETKISDLSVADDEDKIAKIRHLYERELALILQCNQSEQITETGVSTVTGGGRNNYMAFKLSVCVGGVQSGR